VLTGPSRLQWARTVGSQGTPLVGAADLPQAPGVYRFRDRAGRVLYIGRAISLRRRVLSYWGDLGDRAHLAPMVARIARVEVVTCDSAHEAAWLERNLLEHRRPPWNRAAGGQEAEVWIRLSASPRSPGLTVVHRPVPGDFGPYQGGQKVRDAVSGLGRVLPLGYAADGQAGSARDMARLRGASPAVRTELAGAIAAVLDRDQAAVALAFEFAGRLQAELQALDWVTGEQKVTGVQDDADVYGWADGVLVWFEIRDGRMRGWRQRPGGAAAARRRLAGTPPGWADFARRNAELAARLRSPRTELAVRLRSAGRS